MEQGIIRTRKCLNCSAEIAAHLQTCPYCFTIQPAEDLLPPEAYNAVEKKLLDIEKNYHRLILDKRKDIAYYCAIGRILLVPVLAAAATYLLFHNLIFTFLVCIPCGLLSYIRINNAYHYFFQNYKLEKELWKKKYRPEIDALLQSHNFPVEAYQAVVLDIMEKDPYGEYSPLLVVMDPVDE